MFFEGIAERCLELRIWERGNRREESKTETQLALGFISHPHLFLEHVGSPALYLFTTQRVRKQWAGAEGPDFSPDSEIVKSDSLFRWQAPGWR